MVSVMTTLLWQYYKKSNFFITSGCLLSAVQLAIDCKSRLRRKFTQILIFPKPSFAIAYICICRYHFVKKKKYEKYKQYTLSMANAIR